MQNDIDTSAIMKRNESMLDKVNAFSITDDATLAEAGAYLRGIKSFIREVKEKFKPAKKKAKEAHDEICTLEKECLGPSAEAETIIKKKLSTYTAEQEKLEAERAAKLAAELKEKAEAEAMELAENLEANGQKAEAELALEVGVAPVVVPVRKAAKVAGISYRESWDFEIVDRDKVPDEFWIIDDSKLTKYARAMKEQAKVEGVRFFSKRVVAARG